MTDETPFQILQRTGTLPKRPLLAEAAWVQEAISRFGANPTGWTFECPSCGHTQTVGDFLKLGLKGDLAHQECIGRHREDRRERHLGHTPGPCNYTAAGFIRLNTQPVLLEDGETLDVFAFAKNPIEDLLALNGLTTADLPALLERHPKTP